MSKCKECGRSGYHLKWCSHYVADKPKRKPKPMKEYKRAGKLPEPVAAKITNVDKDFTRVREKGGKVHMMPHGSLQGVRFDIRKVGQEGWVRWVSTPSYFFPYFTDRREG